MQQHCCVLGEKIHDPTAEATTFDRDGCFDQPHPSPNPFCSSETAFASRCSPEWKGTLLTGNTVHFRLLTWGHGIGWFSAQLFIWKFVQQQQHCAFVPRCLLSLFYHKKCWLFHLTSLTFLWLPLEPSLVQSLKDIMACLRQLLSDH